MPAVQLRIKFSLSLSLSCTGQVGQARAYPVHLKGNALPTSVHRFLIRKMLIQLPSNCSHNRRWSQLSNTTPAPCRSRCCELYFRRRHHTELPKTRCWLSCRRRPFPVHADGSSWPSLRSPRSDWHEACSSWRTRRNPSPPARDDTTESLHTQN